MHNDNTVSIHTYVYSENKPFPINTVPPTSIWDKIPENETSIPFTVYGSSTYWLPLNKKKTTTSKQTSSAWKSPNTVKSSSKTCLLFGHLLYVVPWTGIIGNLWGYTLLQTCHDTLTKTGSLNPNGRFTKQNYSSHLYNTGKSVQTVSNCNVNSLPKYSVPPLRVGNDLHKWTATQRRENPERVKCLFRLRKRTCVLPPLT